MTRAAAVGEATSPRCDRADPRRRELSSLSADVDDPSVDDRLGDTFGQRVAVATRVATAAMRLVAPRGR